MYQSMYPIIMNLSLKELSDHTIIKNVKIYDIFKTQFI